MGNYYSPFPLRISEELMEKIKVIAVKHKLSAKKEIDYALECYVEKYEKENGTIDVEL